MAPIDTQSPGSVGWRLKRLIDRLSSQRPNYQMLDDYYTGEAACRGLSSKRQREAYQRLMHYSRTNFAELVVEAVRERLTVNAFRTGATGDDAGDSDAWGIWQANALDADSSLIDRWSLSMGDAFVIVGPVDEEIDAPLISIEDPRFVAVEYDAARRRKVTAALKMVRNEELGLDIAYLYVLANGDAWVLRAARKIVSHSELVTIDGLEWVDQQRLPFPVIPVVGFHNRMSDRSRGEFEPVIPILDRINFGLLNRLEVASIQAFRQRAIKGLVSHHPETHEEIDYSNVFNSDPGALWQLPPDADIWESAQVDLGPLQKSIRDDIQDLAAVTRTPLFYLTPDAANGSAEGAALAREGLVYKVEDRQKQFGESWEQVMSLAFRFAGDDERASRRDMEIIWGPAERFTLAQRYDAAVKAKEILPVRTIREDVLQFSPQQVDRMAAEDEFGSLLAPDIPAVA